MVDAGTIRRRLRRLDVPVQQLGELGARPREAFLAEQGVVPEDVAARLEKAAGQRNILVHMYLDVDPAIIFGTLHDDLGVFTDFAAAVLRTLDAE